MKYNEIYPFVGAVSALDSRSIPKGAAGDHLNAREEDGSIRFRYGFRNLSAAQSGFSAILGLAYVQGYSGTTEVEEYITAETVSGNTRFYSRPADDGDPTTEIKNGVTSVNVNASEWVFVVFGSYVYLINPSNSSAPVYRHLIGDATSLTAIAIPTAPANAPTYTVTYGGGSTPYSQITFAGIDPTLAGEVACTGAATNTGSSLNSDNTLSIRHTDSEIESSISVDLNDGSQGVSDFTYNDKFGMTVSFETSSCDWDPSTVRVEFSNNDGSPKTLVPDQIEVKTNPNPPGAGLTGKSYIVQWSWTDKTRADFDNVRNLKIYYKLRLASATVANNDMIVGKPYIGGVDLTAPVDRLPDPDGLSIGYTYYFSTPGFESGISPLLFIPNNVLQGYAPGFGFDPLGAHLEITVTVSADSNVDQFRIYARNPSSEKFFRVATQSDADLTYDYKTSYLEVSRQTEYEPTPFTFANVTAAFPYKGSMVWLYKGGSTNVRFSRVGDELRQASTEDSDDDLAAGETFTLADNFGDEPLGGTQAGDAVMIAGKYGVYTMLGDYPVQMTPPRKVSGSYGVAGKYAFCRWKDDSGQAGIAYLSRDGQMYFSIPGAFTGQEIGDTINLSMYVRDGELSPKDFLFDEQSGFSFTDFSTAQVFADEQQDALWVVMGKRAMVLRRSNILDGIRYWEHYEYTTGGATVSLRYCSGSGKRRLRAIRSDGKFDELEFNSSTGAYITGSNSDGGSAAPAGYWESKTFAGENRRINFVAVERDDTTDTNTVTVYSSRTPAGTAKALTSGEKGTRFLPTDQGETYRIRVTIAETYEPIRRIKVEEFKAGRRRNA